MLIYLYNQLLLMSIIAGLLYIILKFLSTVTHKYFSAAWHHYTYLLISTFFLIPYYSVLSKFNMFTRKAVEWSMTSVIETGPSTDIVSMISTIQLPEKSYEAYSYTDLFPYFLIAGTLIFIAIVVYKNVRINRHIFKSCKKTDNKAILNILSECKHSMGIKKDIPVYTCKCTGTPFVIGLFRPRIVLPDIEFSFEELRYIFKHELTHIKKYDAWIKLLLLFVNALHWFNPFAYMIRRDTDRYCETMADQMATVAMSMEERMRYCELILNVLWNIVHQKPKLFSAFSGERKYLERRINMVLKREKGRKWVRIPAIAMTLVLALAGIAVTYAANNNVKPINAVSYVDKVQETDKIVDSKVILTELTKETTGNYQKLQSKPVDGISLTATESIDETLRPNTEYLGIFKMPMSIDETIRTVFTFLPTSATIEVGILQPNGVIRYITCTGGSADHTFTVTQSGNHYLYLNNTSYNKVDISGYVVY